MKDEYYNQELRETSKAGEYTMVYVKKLFTPEEKAAVAQAIAERPAEDLIL